MTEDRLDSALSRLPKTCHGSVEPLLRAIVHDLNGLVSAVTMGGFSLQEVVKKLDPPIQRGPSPGSRRHLDTLGSLAENLATAAEGAGGYLKRIEAAADGMGA